MMVPPVAFGNADPEVPRREPGGRQQEIILIEANAYPSTGSRKCVWALLLLSTLLLLHVQRDRYVEALKLHGGRLDADAVTLPWEKQALISGNDTYQVTFLGPTLQSSSNFVKVAPGAPLSVNGAEHKVFELDGASTATPRVSCDVDGAGRYLSRTACAARAGTACFAAVQRAVVEPSEQSQEMCHRFVSGEGRSSMRPAGAGGGLLCFRSKLVHAATALKDQSVVVIWHEEVFGSQRSCLARVHFPSMNISGSALVVDAASSVFFDNVTNTIVMLSSSNHVTVADQFEAHTLLPLKRYELPLSLAWFLHAPRVSSGFLLFLGAESPFVGSTFTIDLQTQKLYQQDPPNGHTRRRWVLTSDRSSKPPPVYGGFSNSGGRGAAVPCAATWRKDPGDSRTGGTGSKHTGESP